MALCEIGQQLNEELIAQVDEYQHIPVEVIIYGGDVQRRTLSGETQHALALKNQEVQQASSALTAHERTCDTCRAPSLAQAQEEPVQ